MAMIMVFLWGCATGTIMHQAFEQDREYIRNYGRARIHDDQFVFSYQTGDKFHRRNYRAAFPWKGPDREIVVEPPFDVRRGRVWFFSRGHAVPVIKYIRPPRKAEYDEEHILALYKRNPTMVTLWTQSGQVDSEGNMIDVYSTSPWSTFFIVSGPQDTEHTERLIKVQIPRAGKYRPWWRIAGHSLFLPVAIAIDIVTLPIQIPMAIILYRQLSTIDK